jgi:hypothetical protein
MLCAVQEYGEKAVMISFTAISWYPSGGTKEIHTILFTLGEV